MTNVINLAVEMYVLKPPRQSGYLRWGFPAWATRQCTQGQTKLSSWRCLRGVTVTGGTALLWVKVESYQCRTGLGVKIITMVDKTKTSKRRWVMKRWTNLIQLWSNMIMNHKSFALQRYMLHIFTKCINLYIATCTWNFGIYTQQSHLKCRLFAGENYTG